MKKIIFTILGLVCVVGVILSGCGKQDVSSDAKEAAAESSSSSDLSSDLPTENNPGNETEETIAQTATELVVRFGDGGEPFTMHLYDNDTAAAVARHVGTSDWRLPIYHYDDYEHWEVMQYYDIPRRYEIPSDSEQVTEEKAGCVYYSEPNRIILFYQDAEVSAEYTPVGYFDYTDEFLQAVLDNPVLEGWGNKIVQISTADAQTPPKPATESEALPQENKEQEEAGMKLKIQVGDTIFMATLADNSSVDALKELMADGPLTLDMSDYAGMEKSAGLSATLPQNNEQMNTQAGDIILYQGRTFVIYYDTNSWSLTPIGKIDNVNAEELRETLGAGDVSVTLSIE